MEKKLGDLTQNISEQIKDSYNKNLRRFEQAKENHEKQNMNSLLLYLKEKMILKVYLIFFFKRNL